jgi:hypothetical protein
MRLFKVHQMLEDDPNDAELFEANLRQMDEEELRGALLGYYYGRDGYMSVDPARTFDKEMCIEKLSSLTDDAIGPSLGHLETLHIAMIQVRDSLNIDDFQD